MADPAARLDIEHFLHKRLIGPVYDPITVDVGTGIAAEDQGEVLVIDGAVVIDIRVIDGHGCKRVAQRCRREEGRDR